MNTTNTNTTTEGAANSQSEHIKIKISTSTYSDVVLMMNLEGNYLVMPLDERHSENYRNFDVAKVAAESLAKESGGQVIRKESRVHVW